MEEVCTEMVTIFYQHLVYRLVLRSFAQAVRRAKDLDALVKASLLGRRFPKWSVIHGRGGKCLATKKQFDLNKKNSEGPGVKDCGNAGVLIFLCLIK